MHILLDLQACQSPEGRRRGIGRYSLALAKAIAAHARGHEITVLLNASMGESIEYIRGQFNGLLEQDRLVTWESLSPTACIDPANAFRARAAEVLRIQAIQQLKPDVVHIASLFDGWGDNVIASVPSSHARSYATAITLYDLIPLNHREVYLSDPAFRRWYMEKIDHLQRADVVLGISQFSCNEAAEALNVPDERLIDISGASDACFVRLENALGFKHDLMHRYALQRPFVMYAGGFDSRKNIAALVRAFALLPAELRRSHQLAIVGGAPVPEREALDAIIHETGLEPDEVVFTGYVPDHDLVKLYNLCALYAFPSLQEGFGLPALEAMSCGAVVIGSATSSLPEVIGYEDALFDPRDVNAIAAKMSFALTDESFRAQFRLHAKGHCRRFSWSESAKRAIDAFESALKVRNVATSPVTRSGKAQISAFLPAPNSSVELESLGAVQLYADSDCEGISSSRSLLEFVEDRRGGLAGGILIELADHPYCAKTLPFATTGAVDVLLRDQRFGSALYALAQSASGRKLVAALLYASGGYVALRAGVRGQFAESVLRDLVRPESILTLGRSQLWIARAAVPGGEQPWSWAWRDNLRDVISELTKIKEGRASDGEWQRIAAALDANSTVLRPKAQWLVDISNLAVHDAGTGIQRVVRHVLDELLEAPPHEYRVEPVYLGEDGILRYARSYCQKRYFSSESLPPDDAVELMPGDVYLGLDLAAHLVPQHIDVFRRIRDRGVRQYFVVYDLLPLLRPDCFDPSGLPLFRRWYESIAEVAEGVICISKAVADEFEAWLDQARPERHRPLGIGWFHLGANLEQPAVANADLHRPGLELSELGDRPTFLMVGTVEPRKGHAQALAAFEQLWKQGFEINFLVIGKPGWLVDDLIAHMANHPQRGIRFFWLDGAGDDLLLAAYRRASALVMASEGEGFGLPLIESAHHGLPLIARNLPVFEEIAGEHAHYFSGYGAGDLADALREWLKLDAHGLAPQPAGMQWNSWAEATAQLMNVVLRKGWRHQWSAGVLRRHAASDYRLHTQVGQLIRGRMIANGSAGLLLYGPYVPLGAGRYTVRLFGGGAGTASLDVCSANGARIHLHHPFIAAGYEGSSLVEAELELDMDVADLEVRVWVEGGGCIWLGEVQIAPISLLGEPIAVEQRGEENAKV